VKLELIQSLPLPSSKRDGLINFLTELQKAQGENLLQVAIYGGLTKGKYVPRMSDINLFVLVNDAHKFMETVFTFSAYADLDLQPIIYTQVDLRRSAELFPTRIQSKQRHHLTIYGEDILSKIEIKESDVRRRAKEELHNVLLRLRHDYVLLHHYPGQLLAHIRRYEPTIAAQIYSLLELSKHETPHSDDSISVFQVAAKQFSLPIELLMKLTSIKEGKMPPFEDVHKIIGELTMVLKKLLLTVEEF
jgi:predicted nucleotidyltransferase